MPNAKCKHILALRLKIPTPTKLVKSNCCKKKKLQLFNSAILNIKSHYSSIVKPKTLFYSLNCLPDSPLSRVCLPLKLSSHTVWALPSHLSLAIAANAKLLVFSVDHGSITIRGCIKSDVGHGSWVVGHGSLKSSVGRGLWVSQVQRGVDEFVGLSSPVALVRFWIHCFLIY